MSKRWRSIPTTRVALTDRGVALSLLDRFEEAVASHEEALRIEPHIVGAHVNRGNAMLKLSRLAGSAGGLHRGAGARTGEL